MHGPVFEVSLSCSAANGIGDNRTQLFRDGVLMATLASSMR